MCVFRVKLIILLWIGREIMAAKPCAERVVGTSRICVCNITYCDTFSREVPKKGRFIQYTTSKAGSRFNKVYGDIAFTEDSKFSIDSSYKSLLWLEPRKVYQTIVGFGGAVTDSAGFNWKSLPSVMQKTLIKSISVAATENTNEDTLKPWQEIPGPSSLPLIGQLHHFLPGGSLANAAKRPIADILYEQYGPIVKLDGQFGSPTLILLYDAEASSQVLRGENWMPIRPGFQSLDYFRKKLLKRESPDSPTGLITDHGEAWKKFRSIVNPIMLHSKTIKLYSGTLNEVAEDMVKRMKSQRNEKNMLNSKIDTEMNLWALESIGVVALGGRINCLDPNLPEDSPARKLIQLVHDIFKSADTLDFKPSIWRYISTPAFKRAMKYYSEQIEISKFFIRKAIEDLKSKEKDPNEEKSVLEKLLEIDENIAVIMATDMLFAGVDTAANTMIATLFLLAKNPEKQNKLREEILSNPEKRPYLRACLKESMRIMPVVAGNMRQTSKEYNLMGYKIPKDMYVTFAHQSLSLMEEQYPRPQEFIPERWLTNKEDPLYHGHAHPFANSPFGFGVRSCIGRRIAELETETFLAKVIENFQIEWFGPPLQVKQTSLNYIVGPFNFIFKDV